MRASKVLKLESPVVRITLAAVAGLLFHAGVAGQTCGGGQVAKRADADSGLSRQIKERYGWLYYPTFAKLELARMLPEMNDPPEKLKAPFGTGESILFRLLIKNVSADSRSFMSDSPYRYIRLSLSRDGAPLPYRKDVPEIIKAKDNLATDYSRFEQLKAGEEFTEIIRLADWYETLQPGRYELKVCRRFIWGGEWLETPAISFKVAR